MKSGEIYLNDCIVLNFISCEVVSGEKYNFDFMNPTENNNYWSTNRAPNC